MRKNKSLRKELQALREKREAEERHRLSSAYIDDYLSGKAPGNPIDWEVEFELRCEGLIPSPEEERVGERIVRKENLDKGKRKH